LTHFKKNKLFFVSAYYIIFRDSGIPIAIVRYSGDMKIGLKVIPFNKR